MQPEAYRKDWGGYAREVHERKTAPEWSLPRRVRQTHFDEFFDIRPGDELLDAGCGHGDYSVMSARRGALVHAFDSQPAMVASTEAHLREAALEPRKLTVESVTSISYPDDRFDVVLCLAVLDHLTDHDAVTAVRELVRVTRPGGRVYLNVPMRRAYWWRLGHKIMQLLGLFPAGKTRWYTPQELKLLATMAGLVPGQSLGLWAIPPLSGIYTTDLRRITLLPSPVVRLLDAFHLTLETRLRRIGWFHPYCFHYFLEAHK